MLQAQGQSRFLLPSRRKRRTGATLSHPGRCEDISGSACAVPSLRHPRAGGSARRPDGQAVTSDNVSGRIERLIWMFFGGHHPKCSAGWSRENRRVRGASGLRAADKVNRSRQTLCHGEIYGFASILGSCAAGFFSHSPSHSSTVSYQSAEFCGLRIQCPSSGYSSSFAGTPCIFSAVNN